MFNCLPGAMLEKGHTHQWKKGFSCSRVLSQHNARLTASHRLFNPGPPVAKLEPGRPWRQHWCVTGVARTGPPVATTLVRHRGGWGLPPDDDRVRGDHI